MGRNEKLLKRIRGQKWLLPAGFAMLSLMAAASIALCFVSGLTRLEPDWVFNVAADIVGIAVCAVLFYGCMNAEKDTEETTYLFVALLLSNASALFLDECAWLVQGVASLRFWNLLINVLFYAVGINMVYQFWRYARAALDMDDKLMRWGAHAVQILAVPAALACFANFFAPVYFSVDEAGVYRREALYPLAFAYFAFTICILTVGLLRSDAPRRQKSVVLSFITVPMLNAILTFRTFGISTQYVATLVSIVLIYSILFSDRSKSLAAKETELNMATDIQANMLPRIFPPFPEREEFDLYASMTPAKEVGGDFYDFFLIDDDHLGLVMADVSGKGVPAALFMVIAKTLIKNQAQSCDYSPAKVLTRVNEQLCEGNEAELFVTVWLAILEISTGKGMAANAGHEHPALRRADGKYELVEYRHSPAVATMEGIRFREHEFELHPGDSLFVYTDGVAEATDADNKLYGTERMLDALNRNPSAEPRDVLAAVKQSVDEFVGDAPQFDDITMLCLKYNGTEKESSVSNEKVLRVEADDAKLHEVQDFVGAILEEHDCSPATQMLIEVSLEELFVNISHYAYPEGSGWAEIHAGVADGVATITLIDGGIPYDPLAKPDPDVTLSAEDRQIGGLGIYMVKKKMDEMTYERREDKNVLTIRKKL